jgi:hypothetical protein
VGIFDDLDAQIYPYHFLKEWNQQHEARPLDPLKATQRKDDRSLIFAQNLYAWPELDEGGEQHNRSEIKKIGV